MTPADHQGRHIEHSVRQAARLLSRPEAQSLSLIFIDKVEAFAPAEPQAISNAAKQFGFGRAEASGPPGPLTWIDFEQAIERVRGTQ